MRIIPIPRALGGTFFLSVPENAPPPSPNPSPALSLPFAGVGLGLPILVPIHAPYTVNGSILESQPIICSSPATSTQIIPQGSVFSLLFSSASSATQSALQNGTMVLMRFALADGSTATGSVRVASSLSGSMFFCECVTTQDILHPF